MTHKTTRRKFKILSECWMSNSERDKEFRWFKESNKDKYFFEDIISPKEGNRILSLSKRLSVRDLLKFVERIDKFDFRTITSYENGNPFPQQVSYNIFRGEHKGYLISLYDCPWRRVSISGRFEGTLIGRYYPEEPRGFPSTPSSEYALIDNCIKSLSRELEQQNEELEEEVRRKNELKEREIERRAKLVENQKIKQISANVSLARRVLRGN